MAAAIVLAGIYVVAVVAKSRSPRSFAEYVRPLTSHGALLHALTVAVELLLAALFVLAAGRPSLRDTAGAMSVAFLFVATAAHSTLLARRAPAACQCFGRLSSSSQRIDAAWHPALFALRNAALAATSVLATNAPSWEVPTSALVVAVIVAFGLLVGIARERVLIRRETHPTAQLYGPGMRTLMAHIWWVDGHPRAF
jgi:hypothetical protein